MTKTGGKLFLIKYRSFSETPCTYSGLLHLPSCETVKETSQADGGTFGEFYKYTFVLYSSVLDVFHQVSRGTLWLVNERRKKREKKKVVIYKHDQRPTFHVSRIHREAEQ